MEEFTEIYRFFEEEQYADRLVDGYIWIGTLEGYRKSDDPERGDKDEAIHTYHTGAITGDGTDKNLQTIASRLGAKVSENCKDITFKDCIGKTQIKDAFVLCTTKHFDTGRMEEFRDYCVKIKFPSVFLNLVAQDLYSLFKMRIGGRVAPVIYREREFKGLEPEPGQIGFVKPPDKYAHQQEVRFLWELEGMKTYKPFELKSPISKMFCERIL